MNRVWVCAASRILYTSSVSSKNSMPSPGTCPTCTRGAIVSLLLPMTRAKKLQFQMFFSLSRTLKHHSSSSSSSWFLQQSASSLATVDFSWRLVESVYKLNACTFYRCKHKSIFAYSCVLSQSPRWGCSYQQGNLTLECDYPISQQKHLWCRQQRQHLQMARIKKHFKGLHSPRTPLQGFDVQDLDQVRCYLLTFFG